MNKIFFITAGIFLFGCSNESTTADKKEEAQAPETKVELPFTNRESALTKERAGDASGALKHTERGVVTIGKRRGD